MVWYEPDDFWLDERFIDYESQYDPDDRKYWRNRHPEWGSTFDYEKAHKENRKVRLSKRGVIAFICPLCDTPNSVKMADAKDCRKWGPGGPDPFESSEHSHYEWDVTCHKCKENLKLTF